MPDENWLAFFDAEDRAEFLTEMREALAEADRGGDVNPVETCLRTWRTTARALSDPAVREVLLGGTMDPADFVEVSRPGGDGA